MARALFRIFDSTSTQQINFRTWVMSLSSLSPNATLEDKLRFSFSVFDLNNDGNIETSELRDLLVDLVRHRFVQLSDEEVLDICEQTLRSADRDGNGIIDFSEYSAMVSQSPRFHSDFSLDIRQLAMSVRLKTLSGQPMHSVLSDGAVQERIRAFRRARGDNDNAAAFEDRSMVVHNARRIDSSMNELKSLEPADPDHVNVRV